MRKSLLRRPSPALVVSAIALFVALSGGAYAAASSDSKQDKQIANSAAQAYFNHHIAGASVSHASSANTAASATNATNASNASDLGGQPASAYMPASHVIRSGMVNLTAPATSGQSTSQTLLTVGPFTVTGKCTNAGASGTTDELDATSTAAKSNLGGWYVPAAGTAQKLDSATSIGLIEDSTMYDYNSTLLTPAGQGYTLVGVNIVNPNDAPGTCRFDLAALLLS
jgi:hypothetical protein